VVSHLRKWKMSRKRFTNRRVKQFHLFIGNEFLYVVCKKRRTSFWESLNKVTRTSYFWNIIFPSFFRFSEDRLLDSFSKKSIYYYSCMLATSLYNLNIRHWTTLIILWIMYCIINIKKLEIHQNNIIIQE
jgi:hypothetical protein